MSKLLEAVRTKPRELTRAEDTLKALMSERKRVLEVHGQLKAELQEARTALEAAEVNTGDAEAKARIDGSRADTKAVETARKNLATARDSVKRLEGTERGLTRRLGELREGITSALESLEKAERTFKEALIDAFASDFEEIAARLDPLWREGLALNEYVRRLDKTLDVNFSHPKTRDNVLPHINQAAYLRPDKDQGPPTNKDASTIREILNEVRQLKRSAEKQAKEEPGQPAQEPRALAQM